MKLSPLILVSCAALAALSRPGLAAEEAASPTERKSLRTLVPGERRPLPERRELEMETVAFLGVETGPVSPTLGAQLGLGRGTGLVVQQVVPKSPAEGRLEEHDILLKLEDQLLIDSRQLAVLIRLRKEGDEVTLSYLRAGKPGSVKVRLGRTNVPKLALEWEPAPLALPLAAPGARAEFFRFPSGAGAAREEADRMLSLIRRSPEGGPLRIQIDPEKGPGFRAMAVRTDDSTLTLSDEAGSLELRFQDGKKRLTAKDPSGAEVFSGPVNSPEERSALPPELHARLERLEGMRDLSFRTGAEFRGTETRIVRPRGIDAGEFERIPAPRANGPL